jgi:hypothetical protein
MSGKLFIDNFSFWNVFVAWQMTITFQNFQYFVSEMIIFVEESSEF